MVITLSRCSGQETSECNGSAGSPQYGFMKVQGWRKISVTYLCFQQPETQMNNLRELFASRWHDLINTTQWLCLVFAADSQSLLIQEFRKLPVWTCWIFNYRQAAATAALGEQQSPCGRLTYPFLIIMNTVVHPDTHHSACNKSCDRAPKGAGTCW